MEKNYTIRNVTVEDYTTLIKWWESYEDVEVPDSGLLPNNGLGGFVVEKEGKIRAAAYLYLTNSDIGYVDFLISDPNYKNRDRYEMIIDLINVCSEVAIEEGCRVVWAMTTYDGVVKRCKDLGYDVLDEKHSLIYTHQQTDKSLNKYGKIKQE